MALTAYPIVILTLSMLSAVLLEGLSWLLVYRTAAYRRLQSELERTNKKLAAMKAAPGGATTKGSKQKREARLEDNMKTASKELNAVRMKSALIFSAAMFFAYQMLNKRYGGIVVAKLPFHAPGLMHRLTHSGLEGDDFTDCAAPFLFVMGLMTSRQNLQKIMGWAPPRAVAQYTSPTAGMEAKMK